MINCIVISEEIRKQTYPNERQNKMSEQYKHQQNPTKKESFRPNDKSRRRRMTLKVRIFCSPFPSSDRDEEIRNCQKTVGEKSELITNLKAQVDSVSI